MTAADSNNRVDRRPAAPFRLGVFTRLVDDVAPAQIYARALRLFETAEALGFDTGWVAQHHAHREGGLPSPLIFLTAAAARTSQLRLATGIITLPLEDPLRLAEDAAVLDILSDGRLELGFGTGGNKAVFSMFARDLDRRHADYDRAFAILRAALSGKETGMDAPPIFPPAGRLVSRIWEATFSVDGAIRAAEHGSGLLLARTAVRPGAGSEAPAAEHAPLGDLQWPLVDAYLTSWAKHWTANDAAPRIGLSRSLYVAPTRGEAIADAAEGIRRHAALLAQRGRHLGDLSAEELLTRSDVHFGAPEDVIASLRADRLLAVATDLILQVHPVDPAPEQTLRSLQLIAAEVAPALGWRAAQHGGRRELAANTVH